MNQNDYTGKEHESLKKERFLGDIDAELRLNYRIQKVETDLNLYDSSNLFNKNFNSHL